VIARNPLPSEAPSDFPSRRWATLRRDTGPAQLRAGLRRPQPIPLLDRRYQFPSPPVLGA